MEPKVILVVGKYVEELDTDKLEGEVLLFPELNTRAHDGDVRYPMHPEHVAETAYELFRGALARFDQTSEPVVVVTHSPVVINCAGLFIHHHRLPVGTVVVRMYEGHTTAGMRLAHTYGFDAEGVLTDGWPFGWFEPGATPASAS